ncbi:MAG TPA: TIGR03118 family protein [Anaeromyxobacter sp.]|nr:TIGR03118 family protein [Anaeromyxobacter sp.]
MAKHASGAAVAAALASLILGGCSNGTPTARTAAAAVAVLAPPALASDDGGTTVYVRRDLVSDGCLSAEHTDPNLVNAWGIAATATSFWWVSDNGTGLSTLYDGDGNAQALVVNVTGTGSPPAPAAPTGVVANGGTAFVVSSGGASGPARFLFASEDGTISGWNPGVPPGPSTSTQTIVEVDKGANAVYKGLALASTAAGDRLYATNFRAGTVEVYDGTFQPVGGSGAFVDPRIPAGYAPFGIRVIGELVYVTYAKQDDAKHDDVAGKHHGFLDAYTVDGTLARRVASGGKLDSPWGLALAPSDFGSASDQLLVGNFGDGHLIAYDVTPGHGRLEDREGNQRSGTYLEDLNGPIVIDGLWGLGFGNGGKAGPPSTLFFAAGPDHENHGLFGRLDVPPAASMP